MHGSLVFGYFRYSLRTCELTKQPELAGNEKKWDDLKQFNIYYEGTEIQISVTKWAETVKIYKNVFIDKNTRKLSSKPRTVTTYLTSTGHMFRVKASDYYCYPPQELPCNRIAWNENKDTVEMILAFKSGLWVGLFDFDERSRKKNV